MTTDAMQLKGIFLRSYGFRIVILALGALLALATNSEAASKNGGGGSTTTQPISVQFWLDDLHPLGSLPNKLVADGNSYTTDPTLPATAVVPPYKDGVDYVDAKLGRDQNINVYFGPFKKPVIRHFLLNGGFPAVNAVSPECAPAGAVYTTARPVLANSIPGAGNMIFQIYGRDFDDTPPGFVRHVNARLVFGDDLGRTWSIYFGPRRFPNGYQYAPCGSCMSVERLPNTDLGNSRWRFATEGQPVTDSTGQIVDYVHTGYLYMYNPNPNLKPVEFFAGVINLSLSGTIESLSREPEPSIIGYTVPENPADCPLLH